MTKDQKKEYKLLMLEALDVLVIPKLEEMGKDLKVLKSDVKVLKDDVKVLKGDMQEVKDDLVDVHDTTNRIETLTKSEIKYVDSLDARVLKLEKSKA